MWKRLSVILSILVLTCITVCSAIRCTSCQDCRNIVPSENSNQNNVTCGPAANACVKLTFQSYVSKGCSKLADCSADGLVNNQENTWIHIKSVIGGDVAKMLLNNGYNTDGSSTISCCTTDFCNSGEDHLENSFAILVLVSILNYICN